MNKKEGRYEYILNRLKQYDDISSYSLLDFACGSGARSLEASNYVLKIEGRDCDEMLIQKARENIKECFVDDLVTTLLPDNYADIFICSETLEHIPIKDYNKAINNVYRIASKYICITVPKNKKHSLKNPLHTQYVSREMLRDFFIHNKKCELIHEGFYYKKPNQTKYGNIVEIYKKIGDKYE